MREAPKPEDFGLTEELVKYFGTRVTKTSRRAVAGSWAIFFVCFFVWWYLLKSFWAAVIVGYFFSLIWVPIFCPTKILDLVLGGRDYVEVDRSLEDAKVKNPAYPRFLEFEAAVTAYLPAPGG